MNETELDDCVAASGVSFTPRLRQAIASELESGEHIEWVGKPTPAFLTRKSVSGSALGIIWAAFSVLVIVGLFKKNTDFRLQLFMGFMVLAGVGMLSSPLLSYRRFSRTAYVITDQRAIVIQCGRGNRVSAFPGGKLGDIFRRERRDGSGDIVALQSTAFGPDGRSRAADLLLSRIQGVREVERKLHRLAQQSRTGQ